MSGQGVLDLIESFDRCEVARENWNHRAHLAYALVKLLADPANGDTAIKSGILRYNAAQGITQTPDGGYHESVTQFYIEIVRRFIAKSDAGQPIETLLDQLVIQYGDKELPYTYYSRERLMSWQARTEWVPPDLQPIDWE